MQIFRRMEAADVEVDVVAYNSAIAACAKGGDWEQAWAVFSSKWLPVCICTVKPQPVGFTLSVLRVNHTSQKILMHQQILAAKSVCVGCLLVQRLLRPTDAYFLINVSLMQGQHLINRYASVGLIKCWPLL